MLTLVFYAIQGDQAVLVTPARISNYIYFKVWDEITYPFPNFNSASLGMSQ